MDMTSVSSSTTDGTSEICKQLSEAADRSRQGKSEEQSQKLATLIDRIKSLDARGFIRRQTYSAPTSIDFQRQMFGRQS